MIMYVDEELCIGKYNFFNCCYDNDEHYDVIMIMMMMMVMMMIVLISTYDL
jgi:hypothetical protein